MKTVLKLSKITNIIALCFLIFGAYGLIFTGFLQVIAAILFLIVCPKDKLIYLYFILVAAFFLLWDGTIARLSWVLIIPPYLLIHLSYIIHSKKI
ncbi:hypothetical protein [Psychroserpens luteolus]|uniref:hypothetical protein n=1 Tax=Psychroserpens luteolus TaxID=2855840 RepID=UPI001E2A00D9|nr:hypothetical protein [Psychroserpens luteolus]MCD2260468.1 hypothetical protein [Psychroserpens luteolus]